jgi:hypothetical protein
LWQPSSQSSSDGWTRSRRRSRAPSTRALINWLLPDPISAGLAQRPIWHAAVRLHPDDRDLIGPEWSEIAHRIARAAGIQHPGDKHGCRWIAIQAQPGRLDLLVNLVRPTAHGACSHTKCPCSWTPKAGASSPSWTSSRLQPAQFRNRPPSKPRSPGPPPDRPKPSMPLRNSLGCCGNSPTSAPGPCPPCAASSSTQPTGSTACQTPTAPTGHTSWSGSHADCTHPAGSRRHCRRPPGCRPSRTGAINTPDACATTMAVQPGARRAR